MDQELDRARMVTPYQIMKSIVFTVDGPLDALARSVGISRSEAWRLSRLDHHRGFDAYCACIEMLGIGLMARARHAPIWCVLSSPAGNDPLPLGSTLEALLIRAVSDKSKAKQSPQQISRHRLDCLIRGISPPIVVTLLSLLRGCGGEMMAIGGDGSTRSLTLGASRPRAFTASSQGSKSVREKKSGTPPGRLNVSKGDVLALYQDQGHRVRDIAAKVGVCEERVRKILATYGISLSKQRRQSRIEACRGAVILPMHARKIDRPSDT